MGTAAPNGAVNPTEYPNLAAPPEPGTVSVKWPYAPGVVPTAIIENASAGNLYASASADTDPGPGACQWPVPPYSYKVVALNADGLSYSWEGTAAENDYVLIRLSDTPAAPAAGALTPPTVAVTGDIGVTGAVDVTGSTVAISGTVPVSVAGTVNVGGSVEVSNTVPVSGSVSADVSSVAGTVDVSITETVTVPVTVSETVDVSLTETVTVPVSVSETVDVSIAESITVDTNATPVFVTIPQLYAPPDPPGTLALTTTLEPITGLESTDVPQWPSLLIYFAPGGANGRLLLAFASYPYLAIGSRQFDVAADYSLTCVIPNAGTSISASGVAAADSTADLAVWACDLPPGVYTENGILAGGTESLGAGDTLTAVLLPYWGRVRVSIALAGTTTTIGNDLAQIELQDYAGNVLGYIPIPVVTTANWDGEWVLFCADVDLPPVICTLQIKNAGSSAYTCSYSVTAPIL